MAQSDAIAIEGRLSRVEVVQGVHRDRLDTHEAQLASMMEAVRENAQTAHGDRRFVRGVLAAVGCVWAVVEVVLPWLQRQ